MAALFNQQFRVVACQQNIDTTGAVTGTTATLAPLPNGTSTGSLTAENSSNVTLIMSGAQAVTVGTVYTLTIQ